MLMKPLVQWLMLDATNKTDGFLVWAISAATGSGMVCWLAR